MTALFTVIFVNQWEENKNHIPALIGLGTSALCLMAFGPSNFILPSMALIVPNGFLKKPMGRSRTDDFFLGAIFYYGFFDCTYHRVHPRTAVLVFPQNKETPKYIRYLGRVLPCAIIGMLIVYCVKNVSAPFGAPELISVAVVVLLHKWKHSTLLSIGGPRLAIVTNAGGAGSWPPIVSSNREAPWPSCPRSPDRAWRKHSSLREDR